MHEISHTFAQGKKSGNAVPSKSVAPMPLHCPICYAGISSLLFFACLWWERGGSLLDNWRSAHLAEAGSRWVERSGEKNESAGRQPDLFIFRERTRPHIQFWWDLKTILLNTVDYFTWRNLPGLPSTTRINLSLRHQFVFCTLIHMWRCRINCSYYSSVKKK